MVANSVSLKYVFEKKQYITWIFFTQRDIYENAIIKGSRMKIELKLQ